MTTPRPVTPPPTQDAASQAAMTPARALELLKEGNARFIEGHRAERDLSTQVAATRAGQWPFAAILGCIDSRASAELVFDQGIGDVFSARIAGNVVNEDLLGSLEFACKRAGARLLVVLGHTCCGAVRGACDGLELGNLTGLLARIEPAVASVADETGLERTSANDDFVQRVAERNVELTLAAIREQSPVLAELVDAGEVGLVGAMYDVATGRVSFLGEPAA